MPCGCGMGRRCRRGALRRRVLRVYAQYTFLSEQIAEVEAERRAQLPDLVGSQHREIRQLMQLKGRDQCWD